MAQLRVETVIYPDTDMFYAELYYPEYEVVPIATTEPIYSNSEEAVKESSKLFDYWMSTMTEEIDK